MDNSENFPPSIDLNRISEFYDLIFVDRQIRTYYRHDGIFRLSDTPSNLVKWPRGRYLRALAILNEDIDYFWLRPKVFLNAARKVTRLGLHIGRSPHLQFRDPCRWSLPSALGGEHSRWLYWLLPRPTPPTRRAESRFRLVHLGARPPRPRIRCSTHRQSVSARRFVLPHSDRTHRDEKISCQGNRRICESHDLSAQSHAAEGYQGYGARPLGANLPSGDQEGATAFSPRFSKVFPPSLENTHRRTGYDRMDRRTTQR